MKVFCFNKWAEEITGVVERGKSLSTYLFLSLWPNDLSPCDHCASNGGLMPNKNHWDDKCDVKRSFPRFLLQIFSSEKFLPPQSDSGSVPRSDRVTNTGGRGPDTCLDTESPPFSIARLRHRDSGAEEVTLASRKLVDQTYFVVSFAGFKIPSRILLKVCDSWYPLSKPD